MIKITKKNDVYMHIDGVERSVAEDLYGEFSFMAPNARYDQRFKTGKWDGMIHLYNRQKSTLYMGLIYDLIAFLDKAQLPYTVADEVIGDITTVEPDDIKQLDEVIPVSSGGKAITPYDYQADAVATALSLKRTVLIAATSAGKSLIIYLWMRLIQLQLLEDGKQGKILIIVPRSSLVEQLYSDFEDYSKLDDNWYCHKHVQKISGKYSKTFKNNVIISTWQSLAKADRDMLDEEVVAVAVDEVHTAAASSIKDILSSLKNCPYRIGLTGTLDNSESNKMVIQGLIGPVVKIVSAKELMELGTATKVTVNVMLLKYPKDEIDKLKQVKKELEESSNIYTKDSIKRKKYVMEMELIESYKPRNEFISSLTTVYDGNTIIFHDKKAHAETLKESIKQVKDNVVTINGDIDVDIREDIRTLAELSNDLVIIASYGTSSAGVSIKRLHNLIFASPTKSVVRVLQSIGRMMRLHETKEVANVIDIVDDIGPDCYSLGQAEARLRYYYEQGFDVIFDEFEL